MESRSQPRGTQEDETVDSLKQIPSSAHLTRVIYQGTVIDEEFDLIYVIKRDKFVNSTSEK